MVDEFITQELENLNAFLYLLLGLEDALEIDKELGRVKISQKAKEQEAVVMEFVTSTNDLKFKKMIQVAKDQGYDLNIAKDGSVDGKDIFLFVTLMYFLGNIRPIDYAYILKKELLGRKS